MVAINEHRAGPIDLRQTAVRLGVSGDRFGNDVAGQRLKQACEVLKNGVPNFKPLLPLVFNLRGQPYTIDRYACFEPFFQLHVPQKVVLKCGRQLSKSTSLAAQGVIQSNVLPFFNTLYVAPLFEMIRRFSNDYVRAFIEQSPVRRLWTDTSTSNNVLQRSFTNHSKMYFSFAYMDADRTRGIPADKLSVDEMQDLDFSLLPVIRETLSGSQRPDGLSAIEQFTGTPKTLNNTAEKLWGMSSQAEWVIKCHHGGCGYINIPSLHHDLLKMIGPDHPDISMERPGVICARCGKPIDPKRGRWYHAYPQRKWSFAGYHVPQIVMPLHYSKRTKWQALLAKMAGAYNMPMNQFYNEVLGESYDLGAKLITETDLRQAAILHDNVLEVAMATIENYTHRVLAIDWGGGGEEEVSYTTYAVCGMRPNGQIDVIYGYRSMTPHDHVGEANIALRLMGLFQCSHLAHDYDGAGDLRETLIVQAGIPLGKILPLAYIGAARGTIMQYKEPTAIRSRGYFQVDKTRSLVLTCYLIKMKFIKFFAFDHVSEENKGLLYDFLALIENKVNSRAGSDVYTIVRDPNNSDDFAQAVNYGVMALFNMTQKWPRIAELAALNASVEAMAATNPVTEQDWEDFPY